jgi:hypothetical protein
MTSTILDTAGIRADHLVGRARILTTGAARLFAVSTDAPASDLDAELSRLMPMLEAAQADAGLRGAGPVVVRYLPGVPAWRMDVGVPVTGWAWVRPAGQAALVDLAPIRCAALAHWGGLEHIGESYEALNGAISEASLSATGEGREWYLRFAGDASVENVVLLQLGVTDSS